MSLRCFISIPVCPPSCRCLLKRSYPLSLAALPFSLYLSIPPPDLSLSLSHPTSPAHSSNPLPTASPLVLQRYSFIWSAFHAPVVAISPAQPLFFLSPSVAASVSPSCVPPPPRTPFPPPHHDRTGSVFLLAVDTKRGLPLDRRGACVFPCVNVCVRVREGKPEETAVPLSISTSR